MPTNIDQQAQTKAPAAQPSPGLREEVLSGLLRAGGSVAYAQLVRAVYGLRRDDIPSAERSRLGVSVRGLERKGMVRVTRRWGSWEWGQPQLVELTERGRAIAERL